MAINYRDHTWENLPSTETPLSAASLNLMEAGIKDACDELDARPVVRAAALTSDFAATQSNTTLEDVTGLRLAVAANEILTFQMFLFWSGNSTADMKYGFSVPASATMNWGPVNVVLVDDSIFPTVGANATESTVQTSGANTTIAAAFVNGVLINSSTAGYLQVQVAQNVSTAADLTIKTGSILRGEIWT